MSESTTTTPMPQYQCHKKVSALQIESIVKDADLARTENRDTDNTMTIFPGDRRYAPFKVPHEYWHKHNPQPGGYYVVYEDGYQSYSPAAAFESGYALIEEEVAV